MHQTCTLCEDAEDLLLGLEAMYDLTIEKRDIHTNEVWLDKYFLSVPVIDIEGKQFMYPEMTFDIIASHIEEVQDPSTHA